MTIDTEKDEANPTPIKTIPLGSTDLRIPIMGTGAWAWGDRMFWGYGRGYDENDVQAVFEISLSAGINFFDTAEVYGRGQSERIIGGLIQSLSDNEQPIIATKFMPFPWRWTRGSLLRALRGSLERLQLSSVGLYQIHIPLPPISIETWAGALAEAVEAGLAKTVGVSNYTINQMRRAQAALVKRGVMLASNQVQYSLLDRGIERNGLLQLCKDLNITCIAYSPLAQGLLTGKYTVDKPPTGIRARRYSQRIIEQMQPLLRLMREIGHRHGDKTPAQVALNWIICKGAVPIPGAKTALQVKENLGALGWQLTAAEINELDRESDRLRQEKQA